MSKSKLLYWFYHNESIGNIYQTERFGVVIVFDGLLKLGDPFYIKDREGKTVENDIDLIDLLASILPREAGSNE